MLKRHKDKLLTSGPETFVLCVTFTLPLFTAMNTLHVNEYFISSVNLHFSLKRMWFITIRRNTLDGHSLEVDFNYDSNKNVFGGALKYLVIISHSKHKE